MPEELDLPDHASEASEYKAQLKTAVASLPERESRSRKLSRGEGHPTIAASLGWRENQVRHLLYRGLADIKKKMIFEIDDAGKGPRGGS